VIAMLLVHDIGEIDTGDTSWRENGISHERVVRRIAAPIQAGCPALWAYLEARLEEVREKGWFG
jgi:putative hydrolase of HD superfamily